MSVQIALTLKEIPKSCDKCPFYSELRYRCHNEVGYEARCALGYMTGDMRDISFREGRHAGELYSGCQLSNNLITDKNESND